MIITSDFQVEIVYNAKQCLKNMYFRYVLSFDILIGSLDLFWAFF